jgi:hypothetical protein
MPMYTLNQTSQLKLLMKPRRGDKVRLMYT